MCGHCRWHGVDDHQFDCDLCVITSGGMVQMTISLTMMFVWSLQMACCG